jgi:hypothetical protein
MIKIMAQAGVFDNRVESCIARRGGVSRNGGFNGAQNGRSEQMGFAIGTSSITTLFMGHRCMDHPWRPCHLGHFAAHEDGNSYD